MLRRNPILAAPALLATATLAAFLTPASTRAAATAPTAVSEESRFMAIRLADDARIILQNSKIPPDVAARAATCLLRLAARLDESNNRMLVFLAETSAVAGKTSVQKDALKKAIAADPGDLVSQVAYLDLLSSAGQTLDDRARTFEAAYNQAALDPQIRSEMAVRLASIAEERGDVDAWKTWLSRALTLNDLNVTALESMTRLAGLNPRDIPGRLGALSALVSVGPYRPAAWLEIGRICAHANLHDRGADFFTVALEQLQLQGTAPSGDLLLEMVYEQALAGRRAEAFQTANSLARLPDAPLPAMILTVALTDGELPGILAPTVKSARDTLTERIRAQLADSIKAAPDNPRVLADALGVEFTLMSSPGPKAVEWLDAYAKLVTPDDPTLLRLQGWRAYRNGDLAAAKDPLSKIADTDPLAQVGLARVALQEGRKPDAAKLLQDIWSSHPTGLLALQVVETARKGGIQLADTAWSKQLRDIVARIPAYMITAHRSPREVQLLSVNVPKTSVPLGDSWIMNIRMTNATNRPAAVGDGGLILSTIGLSGGTRGMQATPLGLYATQDIRRVYRLDPGASIDATTRLDQGRVSSILESRQSRTFVMNVTVATAPRMNGAHDMLAGLGGQMIAVGDVERVGFPMGSRQDVDNLLNDLQNAKGAAALPKIRMAGSLLAGIMGDKQDNASLTPDYEKIKKSIVDAILPYATSQDPVVRGIVVRSMPPTTLDALNPPLEAMASDPDPMVRLLWARRASLMAQKLGDLGRTYMDLLEKQDAAEKDDSIKDFLDIGLAETRKTYDELNK